VRPWQSVMSGVHGELTGEVSVCIHAGSIWLINLNANKNELHLG
jgi:hypothetical protein